MTNSELIALEQRDLLRIETVAFWQGNLLCKFDSDSSIWPKAQRDYNIIACKKKIVYFLSCLNETYVSRD